MKISAVAAAAGLSARMGAFKPLEPVNGMPMLEMTLMSLKSGGAGEIVVVTGRESEAVERALAHTGAVFAHNAGFAASAMFDSVKLGLSRLSPCDAAFVLPGDAPLIAPATFGAVRDALDGHEAAVAFYGGAQAHPPLVAARAFGKVLAYGGAGGLRGALDTLDVARVPVDDAACRMDADTPEDLAEIRALARRRNGLSRELCEAFFDEHALLPNIRRHTEATAILARRMAEHIALSGVPIDIQLVYSAALLHDLFRLEPRHEDVCADYFDALGYGALARVIRRHGHFDGQPLELNENAVVFLADKLVKEDGRVSIEERYARALGLFPAGTARGDHIRENVRICHDLIRKYEVLTHDRLLL